MALIHRYLLQENGIDFVGGVHATIDPAFNFTRGYAKTSLNTGSAASSIDRPTLPITSGWNFSNRSFAINVKVKSVNSTSTAQAIFTMYSPASRSSGYGLINRGGRWQIATNGNGTIASPTNPNAEVVINDWQDIWYIIDSSKGIVELYVDGLFSYSKPISASYGIIDFFGLARGFDNSQIQTTNGTLIANIDIYDHVPSMAEIKQSAKNVIAHYKFDENAGANETVYDSSGNGLHGVFGSAGPVSNGVDQVVGHWYGNNYSTLRRIQVPFGNAFPVGTESLIITGYLKYTPPQLPCNLLGTYQGSSGVIAGISAGGVWIIRNSTNSSTSTSSVSPKPDAWSHFILYITRGGSCGLYIDGNFVTSRSASPWIMGSDFTLMGIPNHTNVWSGAMANVRFMRREFDVSMLPELLANTAMRVDDKGNLYSRSFKEGSDIVTGQGTLLYAYSNRIGSGTAPIIEIDGVNRSRNFRGMNTVELDSLGNFVKSNSYDFYASDRWWNNSNTITSGVDLEAVFNEEMDKVPDGHYLLFAMRDHTATPSWKPAAMARIGLTKYADRSSATIPYSAIIRKGYGVIQEVYTAAQADPAISQYRILNGIDTKTYETVSNNFSDIGIMRGVVAYYPMTDNRDLSGNGQNLSVFSNTVVSDPSGMNGTMCDGANTNNAINPTDGPLLQFNRGNNFTISAFCRPGIRQDRGVIGLYTGSTGRYYRLRIRSNGAVSMDIRDTTGNIVEAITTANLYQINDFIHVVATVNWDTNTCSVYFNGGNKAIVDISVIENITPANWGIGRLGTTTTQSFSGFIGEVKFANTVWTDEEIKQEYLRGINTLQITEDGTVLTKEFIEV